MSPNLIRCFRVLLILFPVWWWYIKQSNIVDVWDAGEGILLSMSLPSTSSTFQSQAPQRPCPIVCVMFRSADIYSKSSKNRTNVKVFGAHFFTRDDPNFSMADWVGRWKLTSNLKPYVDQSSCGFEAM